jgi:phage shock protein A
MGTFSRLRYVVAANVNALLEKAEDPEKLLRALIREMEDASEEARVASADLLAEQQRLVRLESQLEAEAAQWHQRAENAVVQDRDDLARAALKAHAEIDDRLRATVDERERMAERITQMEQDMLTLKSKLAEAKSRLKGMQSEGKQDPTSTAAPRATPGERKMRRAMNRFERLQAQVDNLEARVRSYEVGGSQPAVWDERDAGQTDPRIEAELERMKQRLATREQPAAQPEEA